MKTRQNFPEIHPDAIPSMVYADANGNIKDFPEMKMACRSGKWIGLPDKMDLIPLPEGSDLFALPERLPIGINSKDRPLRLDTDPEGSHSPPQAVAAFMAPAHTAIYTAAYESKKNAANLPLFAYTSVGWHKGRFWVAGFRSDYDCRQDANQFNLNIIRKRTLNKLKNHRHNRLIDHLGKCCLTYGCPAARNYFMDRWEAPLPSSPICNANCVGCISLQPSGCCPSTQDRITFIPKPSEICEIAIPHLNKALSPVVSFGQGCEGEPLLQGKILEKAITAIRAETAEGTINLNSNSSLPSMVERLATAGLDSLRVSLNSTRSEYYLRYYRPNGFSLSDVLESISVMKKFNRFVSLNYFILPGFTDDPQEFKALCDLISNYKPDLIQLRNLNMDQDWYYQTVKHHLYTEPLGIRNWFTKLKKLYPDLRFGYYNPPLR